jgi:hypothetical protein
MLSRSNAGWLLAYLLITALAVIMLVQGRKSVVQALDNPAARQQWQAWKKETERRSELPAPAGRRAVTSEEPPSLILMRDHFPVIVLVVWLVETALFLFLMFAWRGSRSQRKRPSIV